MQSTTKKSDTDLKRDVLAELKYEPSVKMTDIGVLVNAGTVTLNGFVSNFGEKWGAVAATKRVAGVRGIADDIEIRLDTSIRLTDGDIAGAAAALLNASDSVPRDSCQVTVREGYVSLEGEVAWQYQRAAAEYAIRNLKGVKGVTNFVAIKSPIQASDVEEVIQAAFQRSALLDAEKVQAVASGSTVVLSGAVRNYSEREDAERAAYSAAGVSFVDNRILVGW